MKINRLTLENLKEVYEIEQSSIVCPWSMELLKKELNNPNFIVLEDEKVLGYGSFYIVADEGDINNIAVKESERGKSHSKIILEKLISLAKEENLTALTLEVSSKNQIAINLYKKYGFKVEGERKNYYEDGSSALIMWKRF